MSAATVHPGWLIVACALVLGPPAPVLATSAEAAPVAVDPAVEATAVVADGDAPLRPDTDALVHDLTFTVAIQTQRGWEIDSQELFEMTPVALESLCRSTPEARLQAMRLLEARERQLGGPPEAAFARAGGDIEAIEDLLLVHRSRLLLAETGRRAAVDCGWRFRPRPTFRGRQTNAGRTILHVDGGGLATLRRSSHGWSFDAGGLGDTESRWSYGGGGSGRLLIGRGFSQRWSGLAGVEVGGAALLDDADKDQRIAIQVFAAAPVVLRWSSLQWHVDVETTPIVQFGAEANLRGIGIRGGTLLAVSTQRVLDVLPWAGFGLSYERMLTGTAGAIGEASVRAGFRIGLDWDFGAPGRDRLAHGYP